MSRGYLKTIADMEREYYLDPQKSGYLRKADDPVMTTTDNVYNPIYGMKVWSQINQEINAWSLIPKTVWNQSGWRVKTARASSTITGGVAENGTLPDTIKPDFDKVTALPKNIAHTFDVSEVQQYVGSVDDSLGDTMGYLREDIAVEHPEQMNRMLLAKAEDGVANLNIESLDRVCCSASEVTGVAGLTAAEALIYTTVLRDGSVPWGDAYVDHNSDVDRPYTMSMLDGAIDGIEEQSGKLPNAILTGHDTRQRILQEQEIMQRYVEPKKVSIGMNGVQTASGIEAGFSVATYRDIPIFVSKDVPKDTISRIFVLNTDLLELRVAKPTQYFEAGMNKGDPFGIDRLGDMGMYRTMVELVCRDFRAQGKVRDIK
ncbi:MAG: hypothetical protein ACT6FG_00240 [Methanosarcinaceae archaeon]